MTGPLHRFPKVNRGRIGGTLKRSVIGLYRSMGSSFRICCGRRFPFSRPFSRWVTSFGVTLAADLSQRQSNVYIGRTKIAAPTRRTFALQSNTRSSRSLLINSPVSDVHNYIVRAFQVRGHFHSVTSLLRDGNRFKQLNKRYILRLSTPHFAT